MPSPLLMPDGELSSRITVNCSFDKVLLDPSFTDGTTSVDRSSWLMSESLKEGAM